ncbi:MAG: response regulator transcription factor [Cohaesibacteraceae bacterium]
MAEHGHENLTQREFEVLQMIAKGMNSREISVFLGIAYYTVRKHRSNILPKLNLHDAAQLQAYAVQHFSNKDQHSKEVLHGIC